MLHWGSSVCEIVQTGWQISLFCMLVHMKSRTWLCVSDLIHIIRPIYLTIKKSNYDPGLWYYSSTHVASITGLSPGFGGSLAGFPRGLSATPPFLILIEAEQKQKEAALSHPSYIWCNSFSFLSYTLLSTLHSVNNETLPIPEVFNKWRCINEGQKL